ncbi:SseB family protein [Plantibacter sp. CFBP 8798]|uniref:SseB family protein n=1 Tax=Plantibacter sp. CFBP 8798 TaxID=2775268 RepID=UPI00177C411A|nr:SseB family protein [Plantibacter sp. CFBP 8798]MBD8468120.1 SseB family protein [Plantibacter sp. CFBP 8798]
MSRAADESSEPDRHGPSGGHAHHAAGGADSAGQPWAGRSFQPNASSGDDGSAPERLIESLRRFRAGEVGEAEVVDAFRDSRLLIPLVAHLGEAGENEHGQLVDKSQELSIVTVTGPDGRTVLPVFSSVQAMSAWNRTARPIPADGVRVALAAASEQTDVVVLDPTSSTEFAVRRPALWAIAQSQPWTPSFADPLVREAFERSIEQELAVVSVRLRAGDPEAKLAGSELVVELGLLQGLTQQELDAVLARLAQRWAADEVIATRVDSLAVSLRPAD